MPVGSRWKLFAGLAAFVGLSVTGTGCRTSPACHVCPPTCDTAHYAPAETPGCASCVAGIGRPVAVATGQYTASDYHPSRPLARIVSRSHGGYRPAEGTPVASAGRPCNSCVQTPQTGAAQVTVLRPVPLPGGETPAGDSWTPVRRVSNEVPVITTTQATIGVPTAGGADMGTIVPIPLPSTTVPTVVQGLAGDNAGGAKNNTLPPPRMTYANNNRGGNNKGANNAKSPPPPRETGPGITHPIDAPSGFKKRALSAYVIEPPDILQIESFGKVGDPKQPIAGPHLVGPDGTVLLGSYGSVFVAGMTKDQAKWAIIAKIRERQTDLSETDAYEGLKVDVAAYNSKFYFIVTDGGGYGEQVYRVPCTGNELVLDALSQIQGLPSVASKYRMWLARATPGGHPLILPIHWDAIVRDGNDAVNWQVYPNDRIYVNADKRIQTDSAVAKFLAPIERILGATLLGSSTYNSISGRGLNQGRQ